MYLIRPPFSLVGIRILLYNFDSNTLDHITFVRCLNLQWNEIITVILNNCNKKNYQVLIFQVRNGPVFHRFIW